MTTRKPITEPAISPDFEFGNYVTSRHDQAVSELEIRSSPLSISKLSSKYGASPSSISRIRARKSWAWLNDTSSQNR